MKKLIAILLCLVLCCGTLCASAKQVICPSLEALFELPEDFEEDELTEEDEEDGMVVYWRGDLVDMAVYMEAADGYTLENLAAEMADTGEQIVNTTVNGKDMICIYGDDEEEKVSFIEYMTVMDDVVVAIAFWYDYQNAEAAQLTADIMNSVVW